MARITSSEKLRRGVHILGAKDRNNARRLCRYLMLLLDMAVEIILACEEMRLFGSTYLTKIGYSGFMGTVDVA